MMNYKFVLLGKFDRKTKQPDEAASKTSSISTTTLSRIVEQLKDNSNRESTDRMYYKVWRSFNQFFIRLDKKPDTWEDRLVLFVGHLISCNRKSQTIRSYISAIKSVLLKDGVTLNENRFLLTSLTKACRLKNDRVCHKLPIRQGLLRLLVSKVDRLFTSPQLYLSKLYKAVLITAYFGLLRIGEVSLGPHVIKAKDVHVATNKRKIMVVLHTSKTHGLDKKPQIIKLTGCNDFELSDNSLQQKNLKRICPFAALRNYTYARKQSKNKEEQFFIVKDRTPLTPGHLCTILHKLLLLNNLDPDMYTFQGIRAGRATDLLDVCGYSLETVRKLGRWRSSAIYTYLRF